MFTKSWYCPDNWARGLLTARNFATWAALSAAPERGEAAPEVAPIQSASHTNENGTPPDCTWRSCHDGAWSSFTSAGMGTSFAWLQRTFPYSSSKKWGYSILDDWRMGVKTPTLNQKQNTHYVDTAYGVYKWWPAQAAITI